MPRVLRTLPSLLLTACSLAPRLSAPPTLTQPTDEANFDVVLWASAFVLISLLINAPSIGPVMRWTGLRRAGRPAERCHAAFMLAHTRLRCVPRRHACSQQQAPVLTSILTLFRHPSLLCHPSSPPCSRISPEKVRGRKRAMADLEAFTAESIAELKQQQDGEFLQGEMKQALDQWFLCCVGQ